VNKKSMRCLCFAHAARTVHCSARVQGAQDTKVMLRGQQTSAMWRHAARYTCKPQARVKASGR
jgi:hypothetical protein